MDVSQVLTVIQTNASVAGVVLIYHLFGLQNWIQVAEQIKTEAKNAATALATESPDRQLIKEKCDSHLTEFPVLTVVLIGILVTVLLVASALVIFEVYPSTLSTANALLVMAPVLTVEIAYLSSTIAFHRQGRSVLRGARDLL